MDLHALQPGYQLGEYRIESLLGEGGFGLTYLAFDTHLDKQVAIKEYMPSDFAVRQNATTIVPKGASATLDYEWGLDAFINEAKTLAKFDDPNIVRIYRFFKENGTAYMVMEYCEGGCLSERFSKTKPMSEAKVRALITPLMNGLQLVHDDEVFHRDIKPDNIMFRLNGTPVLIDFGAARQIVGMKSRSITTIVTPGYAPIEQYSKKGKIGPWTDIYSLAAVAYTCLTGSAPEDATDRIVDDEIKPLANGSSASGFLHAIDKALSVKSSMRPQDLSEWYAMWGDESTSGEDYSQLDDMIEMAGADGVITPNELQALSSKAEKLGLDAVKVQTYIIAIAIKHGWKITGGQDEQSTPPVEGGEKPVDKKPTQAAETDKSAEENKNNKPQGDKPNKSGFWIVASIILLISGGGYYGYTQYQAAEIAKTARAEAYSAWIDAQEVNTESYYQSYILDWPEGTYANQARKAIAQLEKERVAKEALAQRERDAAEAEREARSSFALQLVKDIQSRLKTFGFYTGVLDGDAGNATCRAIKKYKSHNNMSAANCDADTSLLSSLENKKYHADYHQNFSGNTDGWDESESESSRFEVVNGHYEIEGKVSGSAFMNEIDFQINTDRDFEIAVSMRRTSGALNQGVSLIWGRKDSGNQYMFVISGDGNYALLEYKNSDLTYINAAESWAASEALNKGLVGNDVAIRKVGQYYQIYINDQYIEAIAFRPFMGNEIGVTVNPNLQAAFDDFSVTYLD